MQLQIDSSAKCCRGQRAGCSACCQVAPRASALVQHAIHQAADALVSLAGLEPSAGLGGTGILAIVRKVVPTNMQS